MKSLLKKIKRHSYFIVAGYFRFFAKIRLVRWSPTVIVVTGSTGKTTLLHLIEAQFGDRARYSHKANSTYGICFDILGLQRKSFTYIEWVLLVAKAPLSLFASVPKQRIYIAECDVDRPGEGYFLASLLRPHHVLWLNVGQTHGVNFDYLVRKGIFADQLSAIAYEFGYFLSHAQQTVYIPASHIAIDAQLARIGSSVSVIRVDDADSYRINDRQTVFTYKGADIYVPALVPEAVGLSVKAVSMLCEKNNIPFDVHFTRLVLPPGRSTLFQGIHGSHIVDSSYNATIEAMQEMIRTARKLFDSLEDKHDLWFILGDMPEQGDAEKELHRALIHDITVANPSNIIFVGSKIASYIGTEFPNATSFEQPREARVYLESRIQSGDVLLFKGARLFEGMIEGLLAHPEDVHKLPRREQVWNNKRKKWGL